MVSQILSHFELCSLKDDTFETIMIIKSNHHSISVNNLKNSWTTEQNIEVPDNFHFTVSYYVAYPSSIKYAGISDVWWNKILKTHWYELCIVYCIFFKTFIRMWIKLHSGLFFIYLRNSSIGHCIMQRPYSLYNFKSEYYIYIWKLQSNQ